LEDDDDNVRFRAGVLGMPGRCSHEKGTAEARSGEGRNRWNGDGDDGGKKENGEAGARDAAGEWWLGLDGRRRRRRRGVATAEEGVAGAGEGCEGEAGIGEVCVGGDWWWLVGCAAGVGRSGFMLGARRRFGRPGDGSEGRNIIGPHVRHVGC
jgi:hypothetical protein